MQLCMLWYKGIEDTFENAQWRKVKQMQPMQLCMLWYKGIEDTFENAQWRKAKQMQPMWLCFLSGRRFEDSFENTQWRKVRLKWHISICYLDGIGYIQLGKWKLIFVLQRPTGGLLIIIITRSLGALRAPTSSWWPFGPAFCPSGIFDFVLWALRALMPFDPRTDYNYNFLMTIIILTLQRSISF